MTDDQRSSQVLRLMAVGLTTRRLYSAEHPRAIAARDEVAALLRELLHEQDEVTFIRLDDELFVGGMPLADSGDQVGAVVRELSRCTVERLTLLAGIRLDELDQLLDTLADRATETVSPSDHVVVEASSASAAQLGEGMTTPAVSGVAIRDRVQVLRETFAGVRDGEPLPVAVLSELVRSVDQQLRAATSPLALLAPLERDGTAAELWPAVHAHNVAVLTLACAQLLELADLERAEVGLAAVLHDLGKVLGDPNELIRELAHTGPELELDRDHPRRGYAYLIRVPTLPPLVPVVAIEHHVGRLRGGYPALPMAHTAHPVSGMVAVAEAFDVLHTVRAPAGLVSREALSAQLEEMALTRLDPLFVQVITQLMPIDEAEG